MTNDLTRKFRKELITGLSSLVLLVVLAQSDAEMYGYEIAKAMKLDDANPLFKQGAIYPVLRSLHAAGLLDSRVEASEVGPPRRYYRITDQGRKTLAEWLSTWRDMRSFVDDAVLSERVI
ncbi:MAG TPA: PadR family transcriptional regulator [Rhizomicrobium sp.]|nr:PadR family transcriptional regulator [Rhizomicrobium sp.]